MLQEIKQEMCDKMSKSIDSLNQEFLKLRTRQTTSESA